MEPKLESLHRCVSNTSLLTVCVPAYVYDRQAPIKPGMFECVYVYVYKQYDQKGRQIDKLMGIQPSTAIGVSSTEL